MGEAQKVTKQGKVTATFTRDSRKYHLFQIEENEEGLVGTIYFLRSGKSIPDELLVTLKTQAQGQEKGNHGK